MPHERNDTQRHLPSTVTGKCTGNTNTGEDHSCASGFYVSGASSTNKGEDAEANCCTRNFMHPITLHNTPRHTTSSPYHTWLCACPHSDTDRSNAIQVAGRAMRNRLRPSHARVHGGQYLLAAKRPRAAQGHLFEQSRYLAQFAAETCARFSSKQHATHVSSCLRCNTLQSYRCKSGPPSGTAS